jgi:hypothetical protein
MVLVDGRLSLAFYAPGHDSPRRRVGTVPRGPAPRNQRQCHARQIRKKARKNANSLEQGVEFASHLRADIL